jgi:hypothetical protein
VQHANAACQGQAFAQQIASELVSEQHDATRPGALDRDADGGPGRAAVERAGEDEDAQRQAGQQRRDLRTVWQAGKRLASLGRIVDFAWGRRQARRLAGHHQQVHDHQ